MPPKSSLTYALKFNIYQLKKLFFILKNYSDFRSIFREIKSWEHHFGIKSVKNRKRGEKLGTWQDKVT